MRLAGASTPAGSPTTSGPGASLDGFSGAATASRALGERLARWAFAACALVAAAAFATVVWALARQTASFFAEVPLARFLTEGSWAPFAEEPRFGVLPLLAATAQVAAGAALFAAPAGLATAAYLAYYAGARTERFLSASVTLLSGVPTVVLGCLALEFVTPALRRVWPTVEPFNGLAACLVVGLMILPTVAVVSRQALDSVPRSLLEAGLALGASRGRVLARVVAPAAGRGIAAAVVLALARGAGETMIVTMAAGNQARLAWSPLEGLRTLTTFIAQMNMGDAAPGTLAYRAVFAAAAVLFLLAFGTHAAGRALLSRRPGPSPRGRRGFGRRRGFGAGPGAAARLGALHP